MKEKYLKIIFVVILTIIVIMLAMVQPKETAPDEGMKMIMIKYMMDNGSLPHGDDPAILDDVWGTSYGFTPYTPYIIGASFGIIAHNFTDSMDVIYRVARIPSIIFYVLTIIFIIKIAEILFDDKKYRWLFILLFSTFPSIVYTGSYINIDMYAIFTSSFIIYAWMCGLFSNGQDKLDLKIKEKLNKKTKKQDAKKEKVSSKNIVEIWNTKSCILLGIAVGLCALSYYNAYGYILTSIIIFVASIIINKISFKEFIKKAVIISVIALLIGGWFFVRNAIIYEGDFLALNISEETSEKYAQENFKPSTKWLPAKEHLGVYEFLIVTRWLPVTLVTFVAAFGQLLNLRAYVYTYGLYIFVLVVAVIGYFARFYKFKQIKEWRENKFTLLFDICMLINILIPIALDVYYSYFSDYQPQGRYLLPIVIPMMYFVTLGIMPWIEMMKNKKVQNIAIFVLMVAIIVAMGCFVIPVLDYFG